MSGLAEAGRRATPEQTLRKHVYVINGSPDFLDVVREFLQDERYKVTTTNFVPRSFETIEVAQPDLLIVDLVQGEQEGLDLLVKLRVAASTRVIPVLLMSTLPSMLDRVRAEHEIFGGDRYLSKPFDLDDLLETVQEMIGTA
jgi:DNA-binding response OmpR family regulator